MADGKEEAPEKSAVIEAPGTVLGYPCRYRISDIPNASNIVLASHRQPQKISLYMAWFVLQHFATRFIEGMGLVPRDPEGIFIINFGAVKLRPEEAITIEERSSSGIVSPEGVPIPKGGA